VSPYDAPQWAETLQEVIDSADLRAQLTQAGTKVAAGSTWDRGAHRLYELLDDIASGRAAGRP
jgi:hypothetical protein